MALTPYLRALGIGTVAGMRSMSAPAALALSGGQESTRPVLLAAGGELLADKLPFTPARTAPPAFAFRLLTGGWTGGALAARSGGSRLGGIALGALAAGAGTRLFYELRRNLTQQRGWPDLPIALLEDLAAVWLAWIVTADAA